MLSRRGGRGRLGYGQNTTGTVHPRIRGSKSVMEWLKDSAPCKEKSSLGEEGGGEEKKNT